MKEKEVSKECSEVVKRSKIYSEAHKRKTLFKGYQDGVFIYIYCPPENAYAGTCIKKGGLSLKCKVNLHLEAS